MVHTLLYLGRVSCISALFTEHPATTRATTGLINGIITPACNEDFLDMPEGNILKPQLDKFRPRTVFINKLSQLGLDRSTVPELLTDVHRIFAVDKGMLVGDNLKIIFFDEKVALRGRL